MTIAHQRQNRHWLLFLWEDNYRPVLYLSRTPLFFLTCFQILTLLRILSILKLPIRLDKAIFWLRKLNSRRIFNLPKVDFTQMEVPQMLDLHSMSSKRTCKVLVLPGMAKFRHRSSSSYLRLSMVHFSLKSVLYTRIRNAFDTNPLQPRLLSVSRNTLGMLHHYFLKKCSLILMNRSLLFLYFLQIVCSNKLGCSCCLLLLCNCMGLCAQHNVQELTMLISEQVLKAVRHFHRHLGKLSQWITVAQ